MNIKKCVIQLKSFDLDVLGNGCKSIIEIASRDKGIVISDIIHLPRTIRKITVNRSPHIDKKSREQFEIRTYTRILCIKPREGTDTMSVFINGIQNESFIGLDMKAVFTYSYDLVL